MVVGIDVLAADWDASLNAARRKPLLMTSAAALLLAAGVVAMRRRNRHITPDRLKLRRWIITPAALVMLARQLLYTMSMDTASSIRCAHRNMIAMLDQAAQQI